LAARWCPNHGNCTCPYDPVTGWQTIPDDDPALRNSPMEPRRVVTNPECPIHGDETDHDCTTEVKP
jgi:hypothetical protein